MNIKKAITTLVGSLLIFVNATGFSAFAEVSLPDGAVKGLPQRLAALDDEGNAVNSETGEYFFHVENMEYGVTYTKNVQLMNLREDKSYNIYFYTQPLYKKGEIDLEEGCECRFYLDGVQIYKGDVNGKGDEGEIDLTETPLNCGHFDPGDSHILRCEVIWNDLDVLKNVDNGWRLVDKDGTHVLEGPNGEGYVEGEIEFKWIFYAQVSEDTYIDGGGGDRDSSGGTDRDSSDNSSPNDNNGGGNGGSNSSGGGFFPPNTGVLLNSGMFWIVCMGVISLLIMILLVLIFRQKKDRQKDKKP